MQPLRVTDGPQGALCVCIGPFECYLHLDPGPFSPDLMGLVCMVPLLGMAEQDHDRVDLFQQSTTHSSGADGGQ
jgi:hypothetical protein